MGWKSFTEEEILELKSNKYTHTVSASTISFTAEFKEKFWAMYKTGYKPKQILGQLGYNPDILGHNRIGGIRAHIREQALSAEGFHEGRRELIPKRPIEEYAEMPPSRAMIKIMNELAYLRQEVEFIKMAKALKTNHIAENLVDRQFKAHGPRSVLLTDITYIPYNGTFCYLSTVIDAYTKQVLSYVLSESLEVDFVLRTIELLVERHGISLSAETMIHSDQGCHYTSYRFIQIVKDSGLRQSMSRRGNCWDNAPQESFFGHMKDELADEQPAWSCFKDVSDSIDRWMDYYNTERYQWQLAKLSPNEFYEFITTGVYPLPCAVPEGYSGGSAP